MSEAPEAVVAAIEPVVTSQGLALYDVELVGTAGKSRALRVLVDRPDGPLDLDAVATATEAISAALDRLDAAGGKAAAPLKSQYTLEVSSPGLERPLRRPAHWRGAVGATVSVKTATDGEARRRRGVVLAADDDGAELEVDGAPERVAYGDVVQARTVFEWGAQAKPSPGTGKRGRDKREKVKR